MPWNTVGNLKGPPGTNGHTITETAFTVPAVGATATVELEDAAWLVVGQVVWVEGAAGTEAAPLKVTAINGNEVTLLNE